MRDLRLTNILLLILAVPVIFYLLKILSFIFIPLFASMFLALVFLPIMRWLQKKGVHKALSLTIVIGIIFGSIYVSSELIKLSSREIAQTDELFFTKANEKITSTILSIEDYLGISNEHGDNILLDYFNKNKSSFNVGKILGFANRTITMILMTLFFTVLLLAGSINLQVIMKDILFKQEFASVKTFIKIENDILKFLVVKFIMSLLTGIGFTIACMSFDVSFPIFWGLLAFAINFVQMIGSVIAVIMITLFAFVEIENPGMLFLFFAVVGGIEILFGAILEPIFMGKTFSINVITILVMLMFWGFIWGIPGMIMSIPITVLLKIIMERFPRTQKIAKLMAGPEKNFALNLKK
ncbi:AI-2E family transporter [Flavobacteriales bacterium]|nr:AI-2E family transporter [Flavobacteriales bacterium]